MKILKFVFVIVILFMAINLSKAQDNPVLDGAYIREHITERIPVALPNIREEDAMWSKKILRVIQLDEKINHPLYFPITPINYPGGQQPQRSRVSLLYLIYNVGILGEQYNKYTGAKLELEEPNYDFRYPVYELDPGDITNWYRLPIAKDNPDRDSLLSIYVQIKKLIDETDPDSETYDATVAQRIDDTRPMTQLWMWEEWVFDKQRSVMDVRIIAMSPDGWVDGKRIWPFWIYYNDYRPILANHETFNSQNDAERRSFDDIFLKRRFKSFIVAESNVYDNRLISDYLLGIDMIREGERIEGEIFTKEHDMWEY